MPSGASTTSPSLSVTVPAVSAVTAVTAVPTVRGERTTNTQVFLHVGMPKCASTTLQHFFARNDETHRALGFCYPRAFREEAGYRSHLPLLETPLSDLDGAVDAIAAETDGGNYHAVLLSCEEFVASLLDDCQVGRVLTRLNRAFGSENVTCLLLVRNHFRYTESVYSQFLRGGMFEVPDSIIEGTPGSSIGDFLDSFVGLYGFELFEFARIYRLLRDAAPDNGIDVLSVEPADLGGDNVVDILCRRFGLPEGTSDGRYLNSRASGKALLALHRARSAYRFAHFEQRRGMLLRAFAGTEDGVSSLLHLSQALTRRVHRTSRTDAAFFTELFGSVPPQAFGIPEGFPRAFDVEMSLTDAERDAIRYVMEDQEPALATARRIRRANPSQSALQ